MTERQIRRKLSTAKRAARNFAGPGALLHRSPLGTIVRGAPGNIAIFSGSWLVSVYDDRASIEPGRINRIPATIGGVKLDNDPAPELAWSRLQLDKNGRGYIAAEVTCDPKADWTILKVEIVQVADPDTENGEPGTPNATGAAKPLSGNRARAALAMLRQRKDGTLDVFQIRYFDLQHRVALAADGKSARRHFFW